MWQRYSKKRRSINGLLASSPNWEQGIVPVFEYQATVNRVIDGDTIEVSIDLGFCMTWKTPLRLYGINAPETNSKDPVERAMAVLAKKWLTQQIDGKVVRLQSVKPKDKYGRYLAEVWLTSGLQTRSVNDQMVKLELVKPWDGHGEKPV